MKIERPNFKKPPIIEVVCSVAFTPIEKFQSVHFGEFRSKIKAEFPEKMVKPSKNDKSEIRLKLERIFEPLEECDSDYN